jgi:hypothetical protein
MRLAARSPTVAGRWLSLCGAAVLSACAVPGTEDAPSGDAGGASAALRSHEAVLVQGWIGPESFGIGPVLATGASAGEAARDGGPYRLRGLDDAGAALFDIRFGAEHLARVSGESPAHFAWVLPVGAGGPLALASVELHEDGGREYVRSAVLPAGELVAVLAGEGGLTLTARADGLVEARWDATRFPLLQLLDPVTGQVLGFGRRGELTVEFAGSELEVTLSEGVRSAAAVLQVPRP